MNNTDDTCTQLLLNYMNNTYNMSLWTIFVTYKYEEGYYIVIKNNDDIINIIGIEPTITNSVYSPNEMYNIIDITNYTDHYIHQEYTKTYGNHKLYIVSDQQGGVLIVDKHNKFIDNYKHTHNINLDDYIILYKTFYDAYATHDIKNKEDVHKLLSHTYS